MSEESPWKREEDPDRVCAYSTVKQYICRANGEGSTVCDTVKRYFRQCPGRPREEMTVQESHPVDAADPEHGLQDAFPFPQRQRRGFFGMFGGEPSQGRDLHADDGFEDFNPGAEIRDSLLGELRLFKEMFRDFGRQVDDFDEEEAFDSFFGGFGRRRNDPRYQQRSRDPFAVPEETEPSVPSEAPTNPKKGLFSEKPKAPKIQWKHYKDYESDTVEV